MKKQNILTILTSFLAVLFIITACVKEDDVRLDAQLTTNQIKSITSSTATIIGFVIAEGDGMTERGVCYATTENPTTENSKVAYTDSLTSATYNVVLSGLDYATTYYARAYAVTGTATIYGEQIKFKTLPVVPTLSTTAASEITGNSVKSGGNVTVSGGADVTVYGVCYATSASPTVDGDHTEDGKGLGEFTSNVADLMGNTTYYLRAYATNSAGTGYGEQITFKTAIDLPKITTDAATEVDKTTAVTGGNVTYNGGGSVSDRGIVWSLSADPTVDDNKVSMGNGTGTFVVNLDALEKVTTYHVRAFATNEAGTAYGDEITFTTLGDDRTWYVPGGYVAASYPESGYADWSPGESPFIKSSVDDPDHLEGYIYMANENNEWKLTAGPSWDVNWGDDGADGSLDPGGANIVSPAGYYKINANAADMTYTAVATVWGVIGSATPNGWDDETPLTYDPVSMKWRGAVHLTVAEFKFRANHSWDYNYGSTSADENLNAGGENIAVDTESDYFFELDLSTPLNYTYTANRWGVIGDATPTSWDSDTNMTWDETNQVFTVTLDLVASGAFKFRANDGWDVNLGDDGADGSLEPGGANIAVPEDGNYTITLNLFNNTYTLVKN
ncbi:hypothetical protein [Saccharicrinis sp. FJH54]|uniref:hypothetical protein n=1 Tax=Saccharicrinis sp. FJH54 TaxID=3344665 RepID=UPI0035D436FA